MPVYAGKAGVVSDAFVAKDANGEIIQQYWDAGTVLLAPSQDADTVTNGAGVPVAGQRYYAVTCITQPGTSSITLTGNKLYGTLSGLIMAAGSTIYGDITNVTVDAVAGGRYAVYLKL